jgi:alpha-glucosidase
MWGEDSRSPFPWGKESDWDLKILDLYKELIKLRRGSKALAYGGLQWLSIGENHLALLREANNERLLVVLSRSKVSVSLPLEMLEVNQVEGLSGIKPQQSNGNLTFNFEGPNFSIMRLL